MLSLLSLLLLKSSDHFFGVVAAFALCPLYIYIKFFLVLWVVLLIAVASSSLVHCKFPSPSPSSSSAGKQNREPGTRPATLRLRFVACSAVCSLAPFSPSQEYPSLPLYRYIYKYIYVYILHPFCPPFVSLCLLSTLAPFGGGIRRCCVPFLIWAL